LISTADDISLIKQYAATGNKDLIGELFQRHRMFAFAVARKYMDDDDDAKDAAMTVFSGLFDSLKNFVPNDFKPWLHHVIKNHCLMIYRAASAQMRSDDAVKINFYADVESGQSMHLDTDKEHVLNAMEEAVMQLNDEQLICVRMFYLENRSYDDIQKETGYDFKKVKSCIQNGKRNLKIMLTDKFKDITLVLLMLSLLN
jgi:RNA polymerase sigma-70 factor (ECF subfamily)